MTLSRARAALSQARHRIRRQWTSPGKELGSSVNSPEGMRTRIGSQRTREGKKKTRERAGVAKMTGGGVGDELFFSAEKSCCWDELLII